MIELCFCKFQKQLFADFFQISCLLKMLKFSQEKPVLESLFNKVPGLQTVVFFCEYSKTFKNGSFYRTPPMAASKISLDNSM